MQCCIYIQTETPKPIPATPATPAVLTDDLKEQMRAAAAAGDFEALAALVPAPIPGHPGDPSNTERSETFHASVEFPDQPHHAGLWRSIEALLFGVEGREHIRVALMDNAMQRIHAQTFGSVRSVPSFVVLLQTLATAMKD